MSTVNYFPDESIATISTYDALLPYLKGFAEGRVNLLVLIGDCGIGKSRFVKKILENKGCWIEGNATAFAIYSKLYRHRDELIVIDDVDGIYSNRHCVSLLKSVCQSEKVKRVAWNAQARFMEREGLPLEFTTSSRVMIICNEWRTLNRNVGALENRGHVLMFEPNPKEVHEQASEWVRDREILEWFATNLHRANKLSFRHYTRAVELKDLGIEWRNILGKPPGDHRLALVSELLADESFKNQEARAREFVKRRGGCRATYFNLVARLQDGS